MLSHKIQDDIAILRIDHGPVGALDVELCDELSTAFHRAASESRAVILTGSGNTFSAGVDLKRLMNGGEAYIRGFFTSLSRCLHTAFSLPIPFAAAVNGHAVAGGCLLAMAADVAVATTAPSRIGIPELRVGVPFPRVAVEIAHYRLGSLGSHRVILEADTHSSQRAAELGLVDEVSDPEVLLSRSGDLVSRLAMELPLDTFRATKLALRREALDRAIRYSDDDVLNADLWVRRVEDGWLANYLGSLASRPR